jgi:Protein of unknown function (DUF3592)
MSEEMVLSRIIPLIFLLSGIGLLITATRQVTRTRAFLARAAEAPGRIVALEEEPATEPGDARTHRPVVSFQAGPSRVQFKSMAHSSPPQYEVGASVRVLYDPERPIDARIRSFTDLWLLAIVLGGLGGIFTVLGAGLLLGVP